MTLARTRPAHRAAVGSRTRQELAALHRWVHSREPEWWTTAINFQRGPQWVRFADTRWRAQLSFYGTRWGWTRNSHIRYGVTFSLSPGTELTPPQRVILRRSGAYLDVVKAFGKLGYRGKWHNNGSFGLFSKDLRTQAAVREEVELLRNISLKELLAAADRRTRR